MGTDVRARDVYSRVLHGASLSTAVAGQALLIALPLGLGVTALSVRSGARAMRLLARTVEIMLVVPAPAVALMLAFVFGPGPVAATAAVGIALAPAFARAARDGFAPTAAGTPQTGRSLPLQLAPTVVHAFGTATLTRATIDYLGLGVAAPAPARGVMLSHGHGLLAEAWWLTVFPGAAVLLTVLGAMLLGDALGLNHQRRS